MFFAPFVVLLCSARLCSLRVLCNLQKSPHIARDLIKSLYGLRTHAVPMQSKARESLPIFCHLCSPLLPRAPLQSSFAPQPIKSPPCHTTLCSLYIPEMLCSLRMNKSRKVFANSFALAVSIVTKYLCSLHTSRQSQKSHHISRAYESPFAPRTSAVLM